MKNIILLLISSVALVSCTSNVDLAIDNPTEKSIIVKVDTLSVEIPAKEVVWVEMGKGEHEITLEDNSKTKYNFTQSSYFLNPTRNEYLKAEEFYGSPVYQNSYTHTIPTKKVSYYGMEMDGNFDVVKDLINPISWDYGPREALPEMLEMEEQYAVVTKLYDFEEILSIMRQEAEPTEESNTEVSSEPQETSIEEVTISAPASK